MNKLDTALVKSALKEAGFDITESLKEADLVLFNTCSVRQHAEDRVIANLGHMKHLKKSKPHLVVGIMGCMAQRLGKELLEHEAVNLVVGPGQIPHIVSLLEAVMHDQGKQLDISNEIRQQAPDNPDLEAFESKHDSDDKQIPGQAFVRIMRGCNNFCTYCIVPYVRGPEISRPPQAIVEQIEKLAQAGVKQITLLGQTVNAYAYEDAGKTYDLADLLVLVSEVNGIEWIRFVTNYPIEDNFDRIMQAMADLPKVCNYLHMPAQSGSDGMLKAMNRRYTAEQYLDLLKHARAIVPDIAVAGDFIVGFPGETNEDFQKTAELVRQAQYKNCFVFKYSPRPGTTSDNRLEDNVSDAIKQQRNLDLLAVQESVSANLCQTFMGKTVKVLVEGLSKKPHVNAAEHNNLPQLIGRTATDWIVVFNGPETLAGHFAEVTINRVSPLTLFGDLASNT